MARRSGRVGSLTLPTLPWASLEERGKGLPPADGLLMLVAALLAFVGLVMVFSASGVVAGTRYQDSIFYLKRQLAWLAVGFCLMHLASRLDYAIWRKLALPILGVTAVLLVLVLIPGVGTLVKGARRWLRAGPVSIQPAEMVKLVVVLYLAAYLTKKGDRLRDFLKGFVPPLVVVGILAALVVLERDLGTVVVVGLVTLGLLFLAGARLTHLLGLFAMAAPLVAFMVWRSPYRMKRLMTFLDPSKDPTGAGFQVNQSTLAFGSGGLFGVGLGEGKQKLFFLPEAHTDFVLALVGEELGLIGTAAVMVLYMILVVKGFQVAARAREPFGRHLAHGITLLIGLQAMINAGVATGMLPTKGLTLPLVSYGGSSLLVSMTAVGILLSISRDRQGARNLLAAQRPGGGR